MGSSQVSLSNDGGRTWLARRGPTFARLGFTSLTCDARGGCVATAIAGTTVPSGAIVAASYDGGRHWRELFLKRAGENLRYRFNDVWCDAQVHCLVAGTNGTKGFVFVTRDRGRTWSAATLPAQPAQASLAAVACPRPTVCLATQAARAQVYRSLDAGRTWRALAVPSSFAPLLTERGVVTGVTAISCGSPTFCVAGGYIAHTQLQSTTEPFKWVTTDGGRSWYFDQPFAVTGAKSPAAISTGAIACVLPRICTLGVSYGNLYSTHDAGASWARDVSAPPLDSNVLSLSCPSASQCVASVISNFPSQHFLRGSIWVHIKSP